MSAVAQPIITFKSGFALALAPDGESPTELPLEEGRLYSKALQKAYPNMFVVAVTARQAGMKPVMMLRIGPKNDDGFLGGPSKPLALLSPTDLEELNA